MGVRENIDRGVYNMPAWKRKDPAPSAARRRAEHEKIRRRLGAKFKEDVLEEIGIQEHPKADLMFDLAQSYGKDEGLHGVLNHAEVLGALLQGITPADRELRRRTREEVKEEEDVTDETVSKVLDEVFEVEVETDKHIKLKSKKTIDELDELETLHAELDFVVKKNRQAPPPAEKAPKVLPPGKLEDIRERYRR